MSKKNKTPLEIFIESIGLYFSNINKFIKYMTFPVLGQIIGLGLVLLFSYLYAKIMSNLVQTIPALNNFKILLGIAILIIIPGLAIFIKAFWEYLIAYGAINSMLENMLKSGKVYDFDAHTELIKRRTFSFVSLWALFGIFSLISTIPFFSIICAIFTIYFVLIFQVFTYEPEQTPIGCAKRSFELIKGHFLSTFMLFALIGALTYVFIPQLINKFCEYLQITNIFANLIQPFIQELPINELNSTLSYLHLPKLETRQIAFFAIATLITQIFIQYTLPLRSILWSMWYKQLNDGKLGTDYKETKTTRKKSTKPSEKLMQASKKKYSSKKLDRNILRRAMEKDED